MAANDVPCCEPMFWVYLIICVILVCFAGLMSGLTLGLMSLSLVDLEVLAKSGQPNDRLNAEKILPLVKNQHLLLCTLLIYNAMAMEALPIFVDSLLPAWASILISVTLILAFGEIIPQAICSQYGLSVGAKLSVLVRLLVIVLFPIAYPISKMLDWLLGKGHSALLRRSELKTFVDLHSHHAGKGGELTHDEITIIGGALELTTKTAKDAMTPLSKVFSLDIDSTLNKETMELIMNKGHSRVPIYSGNPTNIIGLILVKSLIFCRFEDETPVRNHAIRKISRLHDYLPLYEVLNQLKKCHSHMGIVVRSKHPPKDMSHPTTNSAISGAIHEYHVKEEKKTWRNTSMVNSTTKTGSHNIPVINVTELRESPTMKQEDATTLKVSDLEASSDSSEEEVIGIITMEDVMEELLQEEIYDETDYYVDEHNKIQINMMPGVKKSSSRSPGVSPCRTSPTLQSPTQGFVPSPLIRPTLISSPMRSRLASPTNTYNNETSTRSSPLLYVSTTSYEKLQH